MDNKREPQLPKGKSPKKIILVLAIFIMLLGAQFVLLTDTSQAPQPAGSPSDENTVRDAAGMKKFASYEDLTAFLEENDGNFSGSYSYGIQSLTEERNNWALPESTGDSSAGWGAVKDTAPSGVSTDAPGENYSESQESDSDYSMTNIQVAGVDEGDVIKTDGEYIYSVSGRKVLITKAVPAEEAEIVSAIELEYYPAGIYLRGDKLAVFGSQYEVRTLTDYALLPGGRNGGYSDLRIYDISERKTPRQIKQYDFEGSYEDSRLIGGYIYFVTATSPSWLYGDDVRPMPYVMEDGAVMPQPADPRVYYFDFPYTSQNLTSVTAVNIEDPEAPISGETYVLDGNQNEMYVSAGNMYITFSKYVSEEELALVVIDEFVLPRLSEKEQERIREIRETKAYILGDAEKLAKTMAVYERYFAKFADEEQKAMEEELKAKMNERYVSIASEMHKTIIHKIGIEGGALTYLRQGEVPGRVLNQYAMDESEDGNFRIATTVDATWSGMTDAATKSFNNLYVLDGNMQRLGTLEHIAEGESIYSVRFMGERAYMVTFQRTDPLFVIGLRYPESPVVLGELKVPGYSTYLHPYDSNLLIGLGKEADENGRETGGIKLSLFDASDVANPEEVDNYVFGGYGSDSIALRDPRAFLFSREKNLLVIPAVVREKNASNYYSYKVEAAGSAVFKVDETGFDLRGYIDHRTDTDKKMDYYYGNDIGRNLYIGDNLYSISGNFIKINGLGDLEEVKSIALPAVGNDYRKYYGQGE